MPGPSGRFYPLILFLCVGAFLFALENWRASRTQEGDRIRISAAQVERLERMLEVRYGRPPSPDQTGAEIKAYIDEELLYREALRLGLHTSDEVVRRRLAQTMAFIIEGTAELEIPSDGELQVLYERERRASVAITRIDFEHVFFSAEGFETQEQIDTALILSGLNSGAIHAAAKGDPFLLGSRFQGHSLARVAATFGHGFAAAIAEAEQGKWSGPLTSNYGQHLVLVESRAQAAAPGFEQQRDNLINAWRVNRRHEVRERALEQLRLEFDIEVEEQQRLRVGQL